MQKFKQYKLRELGFFYFLVACTQLYNPPCPLVGRSVGRLVCVSFFLNARYYPCPPIHNWWPCIRPCLFCVRTMKDCIHVWLSMQIHVYEHSCSSVRVFLNVLAHLLGSIFSRVLCDSTPHFVGLSIFLSVRRSVGPSHFTFSALMGVLALLLLPKCSTDLNHGPCPPARDWGSRVSSLVFSYFKCNKWIKTFRHVLIGKYKKAGHWAELLICEDVFKYSSLFSSLFLLFFK